MTRSTLKTAARRLVLLVAWSAAATFFVGPSTSLAQEGDSDQQETTANQDPASPAEAGPPREAKSDGEAKAAGADDQQNEGARQEKIARQLHATYAVAKESLDDLGKIQELEAASAGELAGLRAELERVDRRVTAAESSAVVLDEQIDDDTLPQAVRESLAKKAAVASAALATRRASASGLRKLVDQKRELLDLLSQRADELRRRAEKAAKQKREQRVRLEQAAAAERSALAEAEKARAREARERDEQVRGLIGQRRELLEKTAEVARHQTEQIQEASREHSKRLETFASRRDGIEAARDEFPREPKPKVARQEVDPLFRQVLEHRREVRRSLLRHRELVETAKERVERSRERLEEAREAHQRATERLDELGESVVGEQKLELAQARQKLRDRQLEAARDIAQARTEQLEFDRERLDYYNNVIEQLLPQISQAERAEFYAFFSDENWESAWFGLRQVTARSLEVLEHRAAQFVSLPNKLTSLELWEWILGLCVRLVILGLTIYFARPYTDPVIRRLTRWALRRRLFKRYAPLTVKGAEILRSIIPPVVLYLILDWVVTYLVETFGELVFLSWVLDAFFLFWVAMTLVKVLVLPRRYREESLRTPAPDLSRLGADPTRASLSPVDLINLELSRARKLVRSLRIVLAFWLLEHYVPLAVTTVLGHSVITKLIETIFWWGLAIVVYLVLSTWKNDIAAIFERLAKKRLPRAVEFVKNHKDRFYGVLVIAVAFVYVAFREVGKFAGTQARDTEWSKRLSNFVFRKRIELQQKKGEEALVELQEADELPEAYADFFEQSPLYDENFKVQRDDQIESVIEAVQNWQAGVELGSLALSGEQGVGRTSLVNDIERRLRRDIPDLELARVKLDEKITEPEPTLAFVADLFELDDVPESRDQLVDRLRELPAQVLIVDDCHHLFMRQIGGFRGLDIFLEIVNLTDDIHFWMLTFNKFAWNYINRVHPRQHYFGQVCEVAPFSEREIQELVQRRNALAGHQVSFTELVVTHDEGEDDFYQIIKTANGYFRLLHEFSAGNPAVALRFWKRSIKLDGEATLQVSLFRKPSMRPIQQLDDEYLFVLAAIAQHGALAAEELSEITNSERAFCEMALNYFAERHVVTLVESKRAMISPLYFRQVVKKLTASNFLWD